MNLLKYLNKNLKPLENMKNLKKRSTTIHEDVRRFLGITRDAYALCSYVHYRCADSRQKRAGWCCDNKQDVADFVGLTRPGLYKMSERLSEIGLIEISDSGDFRATPKWIDSETNCKQSLQNGQEENVNKVYTDCKQSLHKKKKNVNKVYTDTYNIELEKSKIEEEDKFSPPFHHVCTIEIPETNIPLEAEKKENDFTGAGPTFEFRACEKCSGAGFRYGRNGRETCDRCDGSRMEPFGAKPYADEFIVTTVTPQEPYVRIVEKAEIPETPGPKSPGEKPGRRSQAAPTIHPENLTAFDHFSDPEKCRMLWGEWIEYKWGQHRDKYKTAKSELVMLRKLYTWSHGKTEIVSSIIEKSVGNLYKGLIDPNEKTGNGTAKRPDLNPAQRQHLALAQYVAQRRIDAENRNAMD